MTRHLDLLEWRSKHLSVLAQTIPDLDMCRFGGIDALDRGDMAHHSSLTTTKALNRIKQEVSAQRLLGLPDE